MRKTINVPIELIRRNRWDRGSIEMLACAIIVKSAYQNSVLYDLSVTNVMRFFGVSHKKAHKLLVAFRSSDLFDYNPLKGCIFAKSFKSNVAVQYGKKMQYRAFADYCRKLRLQDDIHLRDVVRELRNVLALCMVDAVERSKDNLNVGSKNHSVTKPETKKALPHRKVAYAMGFSRSSASRYMKRLEDDRRVSKRRIVAECVIPVLNDQTAKEWFDKHPSTRFAVWHEQGNYSAWLIHGYEYTIINRKDSDSFRNVIHNYRRPRTIIHTTSSSIDGYFPC